MRSSTPAGAYYGIQTLREMLKIYKEKVLVVLSKMNLILKGEEFTLMYLVVKYPSFIF